MKIDDLLYGPYGIKKNTTAGKAAASPGGVDFHKLLEEQLQGMTPAAPAPGVTSLTPMANVSPGLRVEGLSLSEAAIEDLESFGAALENKKLSAADLAPYVEAMEEKAVGMLSVREQLPPDDQLGVLLDRVATVTYLEAAKYHRGDYSA